MEATMIDETGVKPKELTFDNNPNWLKNNDWSDESRIAFAKNIMVFSSRDWSITYKTPQENPDSEKWALWCLISCDTKEQAIEDWNYFINQYNQSELNGGIYD